MCNLWGHLLDFWQDCRNNADRVASGKSYIIPVHFQSVNVLLCACDLSFYVLYIWGKRIKSSDIFSMAKTRTITSRFMWSEFHADDVHQPIHNNKMNVHIKYQRMYVWYRCICSLMTSSANTKMDIVSQTLLFTVVIRSIFRNTTQHTCKHSDAV